MILTFQPRQQLAKQGRAKKLIRQAHRVCKGACSKVEFKPFTLAEGRCREVSAAGHQAAHPCKHKRVKRGLSRWGQSRWGRSRWGTEPMRAT